MLKMMMKRKDEVDTKDNDNDYYHDKDHNNDDVDKNIVNIY